MRHLRESGHLSDGVNVPVRGARGLRGSSTYYSSLWGFAQRCRLAGSAAECEELENGARRVEHRYEDELRRYLGVHGLPELPSAPFFAGLSTMTATELCKVPSLSSWVLAAGTVTDVRNALAHVTGRSPTNEAAGVDLPAELVSRHGVSEGDAVWVLSRLVGDAALVEVVPALMTKLTLTYDSPAMVDWLRWLQPEEISGLAGVTSDDVAAQLYEATTAAMPSEEHLRSLLAADSAGLLPIRQLRPAG